MREQPLDNDTRSLLLTLCEIGVADDAEFVLRLIESSKEELSLYNHVRIANGVAAICGSNLKSRLKRYLSSPEFWEYIPKLSRRPASRLPLRRPENQALFRRVVGACFIEVATQSDCRVLKKLLFHNYDWLAMKAAMKLGELGRVEDLSELSEQLLALADLESDERVAPAVVALCALDRRFHEAQA
jgi:hypothetical protein